MEKTKSITLVNKEITKELADPAIGRALLATTFKGLSAEAMRKAIFEGMIRGFKFKDFLEKNVYAIPFKDSYSLVTSIDYSRKIAQKAGSLGSSAPLFTYDADGKVESCTITVKRKVDGEIGEWSATVFMDEYYRAGKGGYPSLWDSKPRTMLSKVAEMHALRKSCPEALSQTYTEEEMDKEKDDGYDHSEIKDDVEVTSTGDDHSVKEEQEIPGGDEARKNLIMGLVLKKEPGIDLKDAKAIKTFVADYTELELAPVNFVEIIKKLR